MLLKYFNLIKRNKFVEALASTPLNLRYSFSKQLWMANRLGLYKTVINQPVFFYTSRIFVVKSIAKIKRYQFTDEKSKQVSNKILRSWRYRHFRKEFIKETAYLIPKFYCDFFKENPTYLQDEYYFGLFISILDGNFPNTKNYIFTDESLSKFSHSINLDCLYSNLLLTNQEDKLNKLNSWFDFFRLSPVSLKDKRERLSISNLKSICNDEITYHNVPLVSIIVTCFNAEKTIISCLESLLAQSWKNVEVVVVNDCSEDSSASKVKRIINYDSRVTLINLPKNVGTFVAKNIGAKYVSGEYLTCQDADDWAHPQKIEKQVIPLIKDDSLIATTSYWLRIDSEGNYHSRKHYPFLMQNPASPMFRFKEVKNIMGLWHIVRTGADSEFYERLKLNYGTQSILVIDIPLTLASYRTNSLTTSSEFGIYNKKSSLIRLDYWESWRLWHIEQIKSFGMVKLPTLEEQITQYSLFQGIPEQIQVNSSDVYWNLENYKVFNNHNKKLPKF